MKDLNILNYKFYMWMDVYIKGYEILMFFVDIEFKKELVIIFFGWIK